MYIVTRSGTLLVADSHPNQCNHEGCTTYQYTIDVTTGDKLQSTGFAIDHTDIDRIATKAVNNSVASCELMAGIIAVKIQDFCKANSIPLVAVSVQIRPTEGAAYVTYKQEFHPSFNF